MLPNPNPGIRVVDGRTGEDIPQATVTAGAWAFENYRRDFSASVGFDTQVTSRPLQVDRSPDGVFRITPKEFPARARFVGLTVFVLGSTIYEDVGLSVMADAPGYRSVMVSTYPEAPVLPTRVPDAIKSSLGFDENGRLILRLVRPEVPSP